MNMKRLIAFFLLLILLFQLTACGTDVPGDQAELPPDSQTEDPTPWPAPIVGQPEEPDTPPETTETEPTKELTDEERDTAAGVYELAPDDLLPFVFHGYQPFSYKQIIDISTLKENHLYLFYEETGVVQPLSKCAISSHVSTKEHVYYTVADDCTKILRMDYTGSEPIVIYETDRKITNFDFYGMDANGDLAIVLDEKQVILYHIATGETEFIMEQYYIESVLYYDTSLHHRTPDVGPTLHWRGQPTAEDDGGIDFYAYYIELDEMQAFDFPDD